MALRAGYYGLKRKFARKINIEGVIPDRAGLNNPLVAEDELSIKTDDLLSYTMNTGTKNIAPALNNLSQSNITMAVDDIGRVTINGTASATVVNRVDMFLYPGITYILHGRKDADVWVGFQDPVDFSYIASTQAKDNVGYGFVDPTGAPKAVRFVLRVGSGAVLSNYVMEPMVLIDSLGNDPTKYAPNALTNRHLTLRSEETKAAVNGILSAASSAADFAAFKTALAALSPVTRSAAPAERSLQVEEPVEDTQKKTTKKSTKKEDS